MIAGARIWIWFVGPVETMLSNESVWNAAENWVDQVKHSHTSGCLDTGHSVTQALTYRYRYTTFKQLKERKGKNNLMFDSQYLAVARQTKRYNILY